MSAWYVVYTQPGAEICAQRGLENQGFEVYCPRYSRNVRHARSVKRAILASWASDRAAVRDHPGLRMPPGATRAVPIDDILAAMHAIDRPAEGSRASP